MIRALAIAIAILCSSPSFASYDYKPVLDEVTGDLSVKDPIALAKRTDDTIDAAITRAAQALRFRGHPFLALEIESEWNDNFKGTLVGLVGYHMLGLEDVGDHKPLSQWLADVYKKLEAALGKEACHFLHLDDIYTLNYTIPVVFHLSLLGSEWIDQFEYTLHFVPFSGVIAYWGVYIGCEIATWGTGFFVLCPIPSEIARQITVRYIGPPLSYKAYPIFWKKLD